MKKYKTDKKTTGKKKAPQAAKAPKRKDVKEVLKKRKPAQKPPRHWRMGQPTKLNPEVAKKICNFVRLGSWLETAADASGISRLTLYNWSKRGAECLHRREKGEKLSAEDEMYAQFSEDLGKAAAESELIDMDRIDKAAEQIWQAAAWRLERRYPERWRQRSEVRHEGGDAPLKLQEVVPEEITTEDRRAFLVGVIGALVSGIKPLPALSNGEVIDSTATSTGGENGNGSAEQERA